jgi:Uma2 family endonuclease
MTLIQPRQRLTAADFVAFADSAANRERLLELVDGEVHEKMPTLKHGRIAGNITGHLWVYQERIGKGYVQVKVRYQLPNAPHHALIPDVSFILDKTATPERGSAPFMPDLAVEIKSPDDHYRDLQRKAQVYLSLGVRMVWLVYPEKRMVTVHTQDEELPLPLPDDVIDGGQVLAGFSMTVSSVFKGLLL